MSEREPQTAGTRPPAPGHRTSEDPGSPAVMEQSASAADYTPGPPGLSPADQGGPVGPRFWSARRVPAALVAVLAVAGVGLLLYDLAAVRADRSAMRWRRRLADELATRPLDDGWLIAGAAVATAAGVWLLVLAVTPGLRRVLPMRRSTGEPGGADVRAGLDRSAAALVLRDRAMEVAGVQSVRVAVGRRKITARALAHFRDLDEVRGDLDAALTRGLRELGLARQPTLSVSVRRPAKG